MVPVVPRISIAWLMSIRNRSESSHKSCPSTLSAEASFNEWEFAAAGRARTVRVRGNFEANHGDALYEAVLAGIGAATLPGGLPIEDLDSPVDLDRIRSNRTECIFKRP